MCAMDDRPTELEKSYRWSVLLFLLVPFLLAIAPSHPQPALQQASVGEALPPDPGGPGSLYADSIGLSIHDNRLAGVDAVPVLAGEPAPWVQTNGPAGGIINAIIVYVGLVDVHNEAFDAQNDTYLLQTQDGGKTWTPLHLPGTDAMINVMGRAPTDDTLYVGTGGTVYKSSDGGQHWTWIGPPGRNGDMYDIAVEPRDSGVLTLARRAHGIVKSTDGGATWTPVNRGLLNVSVSLLAVPDVPGSGTVYATAVSGEGTFRTTDRGRTWTSVTEGARCGWGPGARGRPCEPIRDAQGRRVRRSGAFARQPRRMMQRCAACSRREMRCTASTCRTSFIGDIRPWLVARLVHRGGKER